MSQRKGVALEKTHITEMVSHNLPYTVYEARWIPTSRRFVVVGSRPRATGALEVYRMETQSKTPVVKLMDIETQSAIRCATFAAADPIQRHVAVGQFDGTIETYDLSGDKRAVFSHKVHTDVINAIDGGYAPGPSEIVCGSRDGTVSVIDPRAEDPVVAKLVPEGDKRDCWAVSVGGTTGPSDRSVVAGFDNADLKMWDLRANAVSWETNLRNGIVSLDFSDKGPLKRLVCGCLEGQIVTFDLTEKNETQGYMSHTQKISDSSTVWTVAHCPQFKDAFATTGASGNVAIWKKEPKSLKSTRIATLPVSSQPVSSFDWHPDKEGLGIMAVYDQTIRIVIVTNLRK